MALRPAHDTQIYELELVNEGSFTNLNVITPGGKEITILSFLEDREITLEQLSDEDREELATEFTFDEHGQVQVFQRL